MSFINQFHITFETKIKNYKLKPTTDGNALITSKKSKVLRKRKLSKKKIGF